MNISRQSIHTILFVIGLIPITCFAVEKNPHIIADSQAIDCLACHKKQPEVKADLTTKNNAVNLAEFHLDGISMCTSCHSEEEGHVVGVSLDFSIPADLPLGKDKTVSCLTCHYTHGSLESDRPQASYSFMDRLFNSERLHKSFLIRRNNVNGELCLTCHNTQQSK